MLTRFVINVIGPVIIWKSMWTGPLQRESPQSRWPKRNSERSLTDKKSNSLFDLQKVVSLFVCWCDRILSGTFKPIALRFRRNQLTRRSCFETSGPFSAFLNFLFGSILFCQIIYQVVSEYMILGVKYRTAIDVMAERSKDAATLSTPLSGIVEAFEELTKILNSRKVSGSQEGLRLDTFCQACSLVSILFSCLGLAFKFAEMEYVSKVPFTIFKLSIGSFVSIVRDEDTNPAYNVDV